MERTLGQQMCRTAGIFQGITALPTILYMGARAWDELNWPYISMYRFITAAATGLMAAGVVFIIVVQRYPKNTKNSTYFLEIVKTSLATALWLWLFLDSMFGPEHEYYIPRPGYRQTKIIEAGLCFLVLPILFYTTLAFSIYDRKSDEAVALDEETRGSEREPLLGSLST